jgi:hypothetical protein
MAKRYQTSLLLRILFPTRLLPLSPLQNGDVINRLSTFCVAFLKIASLFSVLPDLLVPRELLSRLFRRRRLAASNLGPDFEPSLIKHG